ncbi:MAG: GatB/YqeY domain-containing protein [Betaproteobacteria bacterium]|nr:GatB/YqeY domain-containing protein [Betaproteobacteria bacterium]
MSIKTRLTEDMKAAMRARETERLSAIRLALSAIKQREIDERVELDEAGLTAVLDKLIKQRKDSVTQYQAANRQDLADKEQAEIGVLSAYMPQQMSAEEVAAQVAQAVAESGAAGPKDMGKVMALLKPRLAGRADMTAVSGLVKAALV